MLGIILCFLFSAEMTSLRRCVRCYKSPRGIFLSMLVTNFIMFALLLRWMTWTCDNQCDHSVVQHSSNHVIDDTVTFIISDFEEFLNDISFTAGNISFQFPHYKILIISERIPYPPLHLPILDNVQLIVTDAFPDHPIRESRPDHFIQSGYVVIIPDAVRSGPHMSIEYMISFLQKTSAVDKSVTIAAWPTTSDLHCLELSVDLRSWTLNYTQARSKRKLNNNYLTCDALDGRDFVLLISASTLLDFSFPFLRPVYKTIFIQNVLHAKGKVAVDFERNDEDGRWIISKELSLRRDTHMIWKQERNEGIRVSNAYKKLGVKLVRTISAKSLNHPVESHHPIVSTSAYWYGCTRETSRCFGTVLNDVPDYIYAGRWTPPCCLEALRKTARHVCETLASQVIYR